MIQIRNKKQTLKVSRPIPNYNRKSMSTTKNTCEICTAKMTLTRTYTPANAQYKVRDYKCPICGHERSIHDDGYYDNKKWPQAAINDSRRIFKNESIARRV